MDYQVQRYRVLKQMALAYTMKFTGKWMIERFKELEGGVTTSVIVDVSALPEIAATSAGPSANCRVC